MMHALKTPRRNCTYCGRIHPPRRCPAYGKICYKCNKMNHFASVCRTNIFCEPSTSSSNMMPDIFHERGKFSSRNQLFNESFDEFVSALKELAQFCAYGVEYEKEMKNRIISGVVDDNLRLLFQKQQRNMTLSELIDIGHSYISQPKNVIESSTGKKCRRCGQSHPLQKCPASGKECSRCGNRGHSEKMCHTKNIRAKNQKSLTTEAGIKSINTDMNNYGNKAPSTADIEEEKLFTSNNDNTDSLIYLCLDDDNDNYIDWQIQNQRYIVQEIICASAFSCDESSETNNKKKDDKNDLLEYSITNDIGAFSTDGILIPVSSDPTKKESPTRLNNDNEAVSSPKVSVNKKKSVEKSAPLSLLDIDCSELENSVLSDVKTSSTDEILIQAKSDSPDRESSTRSNSYSKARSSPEESVEKEKSVEKSVPLSLLDLECNELEKLFKDSTHPPESCLICEQPFFLDNHDKNLEENPDFQGEPSPMFLALTEILVSFLSKRFPSVHRETLESVVEKFCMEDLRINRRTHEFNFYIPNLQAKLLNKIENCPILGATTHDDVYGDIGNNVDSDAFYSRKLAVMDKVKDLFPDISEDYLGKLIRKYDVDCDENEEVMIETIVNRLVEEDYPKVTVSPKSKVKSTINSEIPTDWSAFIPKQDFLNCKPDNSNPLNDKEIMQCSNFLHYQFYRIKKESLDTLVTLYQRNFFHLLKTLLHELHAKCGIHSFFKSDTLEVNREYSEIQFRVFGYQDSYVIDLDEDYSSGVSEIKLELEVEPRTYDDPVACPDFLLHQLIFTYWYFAFGRKSDFIECGCCYAVDIPGWKAVTCREGHTFCRDCLRRYAKEAVYGEASFRCMTEDCGSVYSFSQLRLALDDTLLAKYDEKTCLDELRKAGLLQRKHGLNARKVDASGENYDDANADEDDMAEEVFFQCPKCPNGALVDKKEMEIFHCPFCSEETCILCGDPWLGEHRGLTCEELETKRRVEGESEAIRKKHEEKMSQIRIRTCNACGVELVKDGGCNKIICRCGAKMCYVCRKTITNVDPYQHFCQHPTDPGRDCRHCTKCKLFMELEKKEDVALAQQQQQLETELNQLNTENTPVNDQARNSETRSSPVQLHFQL